MMLSEVTAIPQASLPLALFKDHLRLGSGFADDGLQDGLLETYLRAAIAAIEARTGKILIAREFLMTETEWREAGKISLPVSPVSAILDVVLVDRAGMETALSPGGWQLVPDLQRPHLACLGTAFPPVPVGGTARIGFLAGFGPDWADLPADLAQAVLLLAAHFYDNRAATGREPALLPFGVLALIERYKTVRLFMGGRR